jgi:hypothetical protein
MYLFWVNGNLAYGKIGLLNLRVYIVCGSTFDAAVFLAAFLLLTAGSFFSFCRIFAPLSNSASSLAARISALVLLFFFGFSSLGGLAVAKALRLD